MSTRARIALWLAVVGIAACAGPRPFVELRENAAVLRPLGTVAVLPFDRPDGKRGLVLGNDLADALEELGVTVIRPVEVLHALPAQALPSAADPVTHAPRLAETLRADTVAIGSVFRLRERSGSAAGSEFGASIAFDVGLYTLPEGGLMRSARFDETQGGLLADPDRARHYPGRGLRFLSVAELGRFGTQRAAGALVRGRRGAR